MCCDGDAQMRFGVFFDQEEDDIDYKSEDSVSDDTDSDIDINEDDALKSDVEDEGEGKQKKKLTSKAYKVGFLSSKLWCTECQFLAECRVLRLCSVDNKYQVQVFEI